MGNSQLQIDNVRIQHINKLKHDDIKNSFFKLPIFKENTYVLQGDILENSFINYSTTEYPSIDFYCFLILLMFQKPFYRSVYESKLKYIWENLWLPDELFRINKLLEDRCIHENMVLTLQGFHLRYDALDYVFEQCKKIK
jgi:hypothetical protein